MLSGGVNLKRCLAAIALPSFLVARADANDASAKELLHTAQVAAETVALDRQGSYATISTAVLHTYEPTIAITKAASAYLSAVKGAATSYTLTATSVATGNKFTLARSANGTLTRSCTIPTRTSAHGGCEHVNATKGTW